MAVASPHAGPPGADRSRPPGEPEAAAPRLLLLAVVACFVFACFAGGATELADELWLQLALGALATAAVGTWLYGGGLSLRPARTGLAGIGLLAAFAAWAGISIGWSVLPDASWAQANRVIAFALVTVLGVVLGSSLRRAPERVGTALALATIPMALYALGGKTLPGVHIGDIINLDQTARFNRLRAPLGYWNALALVCVTGLLPMLHLATRTEASERRRLLAGLGVYLLTLVLALTYSRGGLLALAVGLALLVGFGRARLRTLALWGSCAIAAAIPLAVALSRPDLTTDLIPLDQREDDAALVLLAFVLAGGLLVLWLRALLRMEHRLDSPRLGRLAGRTAGAAAALLVVGLLATGTIHDALDDFTQATPVAKESDPGRVLEANSGNRWVWWEEAAGAWSDKPVKGWGGGSFPVTHRLYRQDTLTVLQPHSVPLQWLAENGLVGFLLGVGALLALLAAAIARVRMLPDELRGAAAALLAVAGAWMVHACFEWSWDIPAITLPVFLCLGVLAARPLSAVPRPRPGRAPLFSAAAVALVLFAVSVILPALSQSRTDQALAAVDQGTSSTALEDAAGKAMYASRLNPLASEPLTAAAAIAERRGLPDDARRLLRRALRRQPYDAEAWLALVRLEVVRGDRAGTLAAAREALEVDPRGPAALALALNARQNLIFPDESGTATGTPLPMEVPITQAP